ncbi:transposase [Oscillatoria amoena NRMC-F 0135]|nr:transposase [Oscillatoria amoena NRMC-F 0135]
MKRMKLQGADGCLDCGERMETPQNLAKRGMMKVKHSNTGQSQFLQPDLKSQLDPRQPLYRLGETIPWGYFKEEFGKHYSEEGRPAKASVALDTGSGLIVGALSFRGNPYDGHTLEPTLNQIQSITGSRPGTAIVDRGYRGRSQIRDTEILVPDNGRKTPESRKAFLRKKFRLRAGIEPIIGHLKTRSNSLATGSKAPQVIKSTSCWPPPLSTSRSGSIKPPLFGSISSSPSHLSFFHPKLKGLFKQRLVI